MLQLLPQLKVPQKAVTEASEEAEEEEATEVAEEEEVASEEEAEVEVDSRKNGPHSPSLEDLSNLDTSNLSKKFIPTLSQSRRLQSLIDLLVTSNTNFPMRLCAFSPSKSKLRPVKELDSRLSSLLVIDKVTSVLVSRSLRKSKSQSRVLFSMLRSILSQSEEDIGVPELVVSIPSQPRLRVSAVLALLDLSQLQEVPVVLPLKLLRKFFNSLVSMMFTPPVPVKPELERTSAELFSNA
jgi:hypothetical protein